MKASQFQTILDDTLEWCRGVLGTKAGEYASEGDRLRNFKQVAHLESKTQAQAVTGLMSKPITSLFDWVAEDQDRTMEEWDEKIGDSINYLVLLKAVLIEEKELKAQKGSSDKIKLDLPKGSITSVQPSTIYDQTRAGLRQTQSQETNS